MSTLAKRNGRPATCPGRPATGRVTDAADGAHGRGRTVPVEMTRPTLVGLYIFALVCTVVCVDIVFFRDQPAEQLIANIVIVVVFLTIYMGFLR